MSKEAHEKRAQRIISSLKAQYPNADCWDVDGGGTHFVAEIDPSKDHPEFDKAVEVVISSKPL